jgi:hypothetical protein
MHYMLIQGYSDIKKVNLYHMCVLLKLMGIQSAINICQTEKINKENK